MDVAFPDLTLASFAQASKSLIHQGPYWLSRESSRRLPPTISLVSPFESRVLLRWLHGLYLQQGNDGIQGAQTRFSVARCVALLSVSPFQLQVPTLGGGFEAFFFSGRFSS